MDKNSKQIAPLRKRVSRRDFFGHCSAVASYAVSGSVAAPLVLAAELAQIEPGPQLVRIGLCGLGHRGLELADSVRKTAGMEIVAWFDPSQSSINRAESQFRRNQSALPAVVSSCDELFQCNDVDAVIIASPSNEHFCQIQKALSSGKHVLTEKPVGLTREESSSILEQVEKLDHQVFMVGFQRRFHPHRMELLKWLKLNPFGNLLDVSVVWTHPQGAPQGVGGWMTDTTRTGDWVTEDGDHIWDLFPEIHPQMPQVLNFTNYSSATGGSAYWVATLKWLDGPIATVRESFLPGAWSRSPGLCFTLQFEKAQVEIVTGHITCFSGELDRLPDLPAYLLEVDRNSNSGFREKVNETGLLVCNFASKVRNASQKSFVIQNNMEVSQRLRWTQELRENVVKS